MTLDKCYIIGINDHNGIILRRLLISIGHKYPGNCYVLHYSNRIYLAFGFYENKTIFSDYVEGDLINVPEYDADDVIAFLKSPMYKDIYGN